MLPLPGAALVMSIPFSERFPTLAEVILGGRNLSINKMCFWLDNQPLVELISWQPPSSDAASHLLCLFVLCHFCFFEQAVIFKESSQIPLIKLLMFSFI